MLIVLGGHLSENLFFNVLSLQFHIPEIQYPVELLYGVNSSQFSSVTQACLTLSDPMDCSTPGFPVHHQLPELAQTYVPRVGDAIHPSHPLSSPSPDFSLSQHQGLFW